MHFTIQSLIRLWSEHWAPPLGSLDLLTNTSLLPNATYYTTSKDPKK